jgi:N-acetylmuramoyl-L-alanine amidase
MRSFGRRLGPLSRHTAATKNFATRTSGAKLVNGPIADRHHIDRYHIGRVGKARVMRQPRHAGLVLLAALLVLSAGADRRVAWSEERTPATAAPAEPSCQRSAFRVVVDVGHTLDVFGAMSARGVPEYSYNVRLGDAVAQALLDAGFAKTVLLITDKPPLPGLYERTARANQIRADLFIAIHHDSVPDNLLQTWQYAGQQHIFNDQYPGYALFISNDNADRAGSLQFGQFLGHALQARGLQFTPHYTLALMGHRRRQLVDADAGVYRYDQLIVLRTARMPALLIEAGSIVNRDEELELASPERRATTSAAIAAAVEDFCAARAHPKTEHLAKQPPLHAGHGAAASAR